MDPDEVPSMEQCQTELKEEQLKPRIYASMMPHGP